MNFFLWFFGEILMATCLKLHKNTLLHGMVQGADGAVGGNPPMAAN
jgi:hypothetical protein